MPAFGLIGDQFGNHGGEAIGSQTKGGSGVTRAFLEATGKPRQCTANRCRPGATKEFPGPLRVPGYAIGFALADFHGGGSEVDEPLIESGLWSGPAEGIPKALPCFVCFPIPAAVEEVHRVEPLRVGGERGGKNAAPGGGVGREVREEGGRVESVAGLIVDGAVRMATGVVHRVRQVMAGHVGVGRQRVGRGVAGCHGGSLREARSWVRVGRDVWVAAEVLRATGDAPEFADAVPPLPSLPYPLLSPGQHRQPARDSGCSGCSSPGRELARRVARAYRETIQALSEKPTVGALYERMTAADIEALAEEVNGKRQLKSKPPVLERCEDEAIRQGFSIETAKYPTIETYADLCAHTLARAHARSGDTVAIAAYLGDDKAFADAVECSPWPRQTS